MSDAASASPWVLVAGGFHQRGGMDKANAALARFLLHEAVPVHLVGHCIDPEFLGNRTVTAHTVSRPAASYFLGEGLLERRGRAVARAVTARWPRAHVVLNGGNCAWPGTNWVHCVHHAWDCADQDSGPLFRVRNRLMKSLIRRRERVALRMARLVIANSEQTRNQLVKQLHLDPERVQRVYLGSEPNVGIPTLAERVANRAWLGKPIERPLACFVGALGRDNHKGFDTLWSAWRQLCARPDWDADLVVCGGGDGVSHWKAQIEQAGLAERVTLLGFTDRIADVLGAADILVSPSRYDAYGLNVQEAICRGIPAVASGRAGVSERYTPDLREMILAEPDSAPDLAKILLLWRSDMQGWRDRFQPLGARLRSYTWSDMAARLFSLISQTELSRAIA